MLKRAFVASRPDEKASIGGFSRENRTPKSFSRDLDTLLTPNDHMPGLITGKFVPRKAPWTAPTLWRFPTGNRWPNCQNSMRTWRDTTLDSKKPFLVAMLRIHNGPRSERFCTPQRRNPPAEFVLAISHTLVQVTTQGAFSWFAPCG